MGDSYTLEWQLTRNGSEAYDTIYGIRVTSTTPDSTAHVEIEQSFTDLNEYLNDDDGNGILRLMNYIMPDVSHFNYGDGNEIFTSWLENVYLNNPDYGSPTAIPTTKNDINNVYHMFYAGVKKDGSKVYETGTPTETVMTSPAGTFPVPSLDEICESSVSKKIDWKGDEGVSGMDDLYRLYLDFTAEVNPIDMLLVVDQSGSMKMDLQGNEATLANGDPNPAFSGTSRQQILRNFLNGTDNNGFISRFMSNEDNHLAIVTFANDSNSNVPTATNPNGRYKYQWGDRDAYGDDATFKDDNGYCDHLNNFMFSSSDSAVPSFPMVADFRDVTIDSIPGISSLFGGFVDENDDPDPDASTFLDWYNTLDADEIYNWLEGGFVNGEFHEASEVSIESYNLFELSKSAFKQYQQKHPDIMTYSIGFGDSVTGTYADGVTGKEDVLKYMTGEEGVATDECKRFFHCGSEGGSDKMIQTFNDITQMKDVVMTDILSDNVALADTSNLVITLKKGTAAPVTLMSGGVPTTAGSELLNLDSGATGFTTVDGKTCLKVVFKDSFVFTEKVNIEAAFTVKTTEAAKTAYVDAGYDYPDTGDYDYQYRKDTNGDFVLDTNGNKIPVLDENNEKIIDPITDYDEDSVRSSGEKGLYSNLSESGGEKTGVTWTHLGSQEKPFPMPVVQLSEKPVKPEDPNEPPGTIDPVPFEDTVSIGKTIDFLGNNTGATGDMNDMYRLYLTLEAKAQPTDLLVVIDASSSMKASLGTDGVRMQVLLDFLNGTRTSDGGTPDDLSDDTYPGNGFIYQFLNANTDNDLAMVTFSNASSLSDSNYIYHWGDGELDKYTVDPIATQTYTNYAAGLAAANEIWKDKADSENQKIIIFLSDGYPTVAYADGQMHLEYDEGVDPVGAGMYDQDDRFLYAIEYYLYITYFDAVGTNGDHYYRDQYYKEGVNLSGVSTTFEDSSGNGYNYYPWYSGWYPNNGGVYYPTEISLNNIEIPDIPGLEDTLDGDFSDAEAFKTWYTGLNPGASSDIHGDNIRNWLNSHDINCDKSIDMLWLSEHAYKQFAGLNPEVMTYSVGFGTSTGTFYNSSRVADEALIYMAAGDISKTTAERYYHVTTADALTDAMTSIALQKGISLHDTLSDYVDFAADPDFEITLTDTKYQNAAGYPYLYTHRDGYTTTDGFTALGQLLLDTDATGWNKNTHKVDVVFKEDAAFNEDMKVEASFDVKLTAKAYTDKETLGDTYGGTKGDYEVQLNDSGQPVLDGEGHQVIVPITDHDTAKATSSGEYGFYSNNNSLAKASWNVGGDANQKNFPKPVVQVPDTATIKLRKTGTSVYTTRIAGAEFDLYAACESTAQGAVSIPDATDKY